MGPTLEAYPGELLISSSKPESSAGVVLREFVRRCSVIPLIPKP